MPILQNHIASAGMLYYDVLKSQIKLINCGTHLAKELVFGSNKDLLYGCIPWRNVEFHIRVHQFI